MQKKRNTFNCYCYAENNPVAFNLFNTCETATDHWQSTGEDAGLDGSCQGARVPMSTVKMSSSALFMMPTNCMVDNQYACKTSAKDVAPSIDLTPADNKTYKYTKVLVRTTANSGFGSYVAYVDGKPCSEKVLLLGQQLHEIECDAVGRVVQVRFFPSFLSSDRSMELAYVGAEGEESEIKLGFSPIVNFNLKPKVK